MHYQPKINMASGEVAGLEALIRWNDPELGSVPPAKFVSLLEETGMILAAGRWALARRSTTSTAGSRSASKCRAPR